MENIFKPGINFIGVGVFALIGNDRGGVILTQAKSSEKKGKDYEDIWSMPGGTLEFGETCEEGLRREIKEELDIDIFGIELLGYNDYIKDGKHWLALNFSASTKGEAKNMEPDKNRSVLWFDLENIPENVSIYTKKCCEVALRKQKNKS